VPRKIKAIGLVSGGLDSALAVALVRRQGIEVLGLHILIGFSASVVRREVAGEEIEDIVAAESNRMSNDFGVPVRILDFSQEYFGILLHPRHGYGAHMNPCIDCHAFMLRKAKEVMEREGADFVFTGEVLGQRPMSQHRAALELVERESDLAGLLLRPLSGRLLPETVAERNGWIDREKLCDIEGRSRKRQIELSAELGVKGYASPGGGCMLTDEHYAARLRDIVRHPGKSPLTHDDTLLLAVGRHFRLSSTVKLVAGRREAENLYLERRWSHEWLAFPIDAPGATVLIQGEPTEEEMRAAAAVAARYSDAKDLAVVKIVLRRGASEKVFEVPPAPNEVVERHRV
jgi:tRNA-specific 2-thiouridylase